MREFELYYYCCLLGAVRERVVGFGAFVCTDVLSFFVRFFVVVVAVVAIDGA